jgi:Holliday junction DNA helicase RuvA
MIAWLRGVPLEVLDGGSIVMNVQDVGYEVYVASPNHMILGDETDLFIYTVVRDDAIVLYGFNSIRERSFFTLLLATPGVGPSTALAALRTFSINEMVAAIEHDDAKRIAEIPGVGLKTANRIVLELKGKVAIDANAGPVRAPDKSSSDIHEALKALGYSIAEIRAALDDVDLPSDEASALRTALHLLGRQ